MIRTTRQASLGLVLALSLIASTSPSAVADDPQFHSQAEHTIALGAQEARNTFTVNAGTIHCQTATFEGTTSKATTSEATVAPNYQGCKITTVTLETLEAVADMNGCHYLFTSSGQVHLTCPSTPIRVTAPLCTVTVHPQTVERVNYTNVGSSATTSPTVTSTATGIAYTQSPFCPGGGGGSFTNGTYAGTVATTCEETVGAHVGCSWGTPPPPQFHSEAEHTIALGAQEARNTFTVNAGTIHCQTATFEGTTSKATTSEATVAPNYQGCKITTVTLETLEAVADMNGCHYLFTSSGQVHLTCPSTPIRVTAPLCTVTVHPQTVERVDYTNVGSSATTSPTVTSTATGIAYTQSSLCPGGGGGSFTNGTYAGTVATTCEETVENHVGCKWNEPLPPRPVSSQFHSETEHTQVFGEQEVRNAFAVNAGTIHCATATFVGTASKATVSEVTIAPTYQGCKITTVTEEALDAVVDMNGCHYLFTPNGQVHLTCPSEPIRVTASSCTITVHPQTVESVDYTIVGSGATTTPTVTSTATGIDYTESAACPGGGGSFSNGTSSGTVATTCADTILSHVGCWPSTE